MTDESKSTLAQKWFALLAGAICGIFVYLFLVYILLHGNPNAETQPIAFTVFIGGLGIAVLMHWEKAGCFAIFFAGISAGALVCWFFGGYMLLAAIAVFAVMYPAGKRVLKLFGIDPDKRPE